MLQDISAPNDSKSSDAFAFLQSKLQEEYAEDLVEIRKSEDEFEELKRNLNAN